MKGRWEDQPRLTRQDEIEAKWEPIHQALHAHDGARATKLWEQADDDMKTALSVRMEHWFRRELALPSNRREWWNDKEGLNRLIYMIRPELPVRSFSPRMAKKLFDYFDSYDETYGRSAREKLRG